MRRFFMPIVEFLGWLLLLLVIVAAGVCVWCVMETAVHTVRRMGEGFP